MRCKKCGLENMEGATFCAGCGERLNGENAQSEVQHNTPVQETMGYNNPPVNTGYSNAQANNSQAGNYNQGAPIEFDEKAAITVLVLSILCCGNLISLGFVIWGLVEGGKVKDYLIQGNEDMAKLTLEKANKYVKIAGIIFIIGAIITSLRIAAVFINLIFTLN